MSRPDSINDLIERYLDDVAPPGEVERLQDRLEKSTEAADAFAEAVLFDALLQTAFSEKPRTANDAFAALAADGRHDPIDLEFGDFGIGGSGFGDLGFGIWDLEHGNPKFQIPNQQIPPLSTLHSPLSTNFVGGPVFSYIAATLILGVMLLSAWAYTITHDYGPSLATNSRGLTAPGEPAPQRPDPIFVARVTGMKDCRWSDPATETYAGAYVPLGRKYALASGLIEITYLSGAKVILEGPCRYEVESTAGGFLALGKLTARVEKRSEVRGQRPESGGLAVSAASAQPQVENLPSPIGRGAGGEGNGNQKQSALTLTLSQRERGPDSSPKPQAPRPKTQDLRPKTQDLSPKTQAPRPKTQDLSPKTEISKSPNLQISKFTVRTPTAVVTDLGTEFGVAVDENGDTTSHVFQGSIVVQGFAAASTRREPSPENPKSQIPNSKSQIILAAGQSARVEKDAATGAARIVTDEKAVAAPRFVRRILQPVRELDLLDIVAGGNGTGRNREKGIHPLTGQRHFWYYGKAFSGENRYQTVAWHKFIDGVFIPDGRNGAVQTDSAGTRFDGFPYTDGATYGSIWARSADHPTLSDKQIQSEPRDDWMVCIGDGRKFMAENRGLLAFHSDSAITFDLEAMRKTFPNVRPGRFRAIGGMIDVSAINPKADSSADVWIIVDGRVLFKRRQVRVEDGAFKLEAELGPKDRFLTLAATDGGNGYACDCLVFGDPVLEMIDIGREAGP